MTCSYFHPSDSSISSSIAATSSLMAPSNTLRGDDADISNIRAYLSTPCHSFGDCADEAKNCNFLQANVGERETLEDEDEKVGDAQAVAAGPGYQQVPEENAQGLQEPLPNIVFDEERNVFRLA
uniref:Uncharacterized protein n=1 Tax=Ditylenchus dipsaci TaxID=166011 RepID=A0A915DXJ3_9BILA